MTIIELRDRVIEDGIKSILEHEHKDSHILGGLAGFEICRALETREEYQRVLKERETEEVRWEHKKETLDAYWQHRYATLQVEWTYKVLMVAWARPGEMLSGRAMMKYAEIVGVAGVENEAGAD